MAFDKLAHPRELLRRRELLVERVVQLGRQRSAHVCLQGLAAFDRVRDMGDRRVVGRKGEHRTHLRERERRIL